MDARTWVSQVSLIALIGVIGISAPHALGRVIRKAEEERVMEHYVPEALVNELAHAQDVNRMARHEKLTVLFADIRDFTRLSQPLRPEESVGFLNRYFSAIVSPIAEQNGVIDKYLGDGVLALFEGERNARCAVRAA